MMDALSRSRQLANYCRRGSRIADELDDDDLANLALADLVHLRKWAHTAATSLTTLVEDLDAERGQRS